jgi:hypothetical protein
MLDGIIFFGGLFALLFVALALRIADARGGYSAEEKKARLQKRLPFVMGAFFALVGFILVRSM